MLFKALLFTVGTFSAIGFGLYVGTGETWFLITGMLMLLALGCFALILGFLAQTAENLH